MIETLGAFSLLFAQLVTVGMLCIGMTILLRGMR